MGKIRDSRLYCQLGFTVVEMIITVSIVLIISAIALPGFRLISDNSFKEAVEELTDNIKMYEYEAAQQLETVSTSNVSFNPTNRTYTITPPTESARTYILPNNVTLAVADKNGVISGISQYTYNARVKVNNLYRLLTLTNTSTGSTQYIIISTATGRVRVSNSNAVLNNEK